MAGHDAIWTYMSYGPFADFKTFSFVLLILINVLERWSKRHVS